MSMTYRIDHVSVSAFPLLSSPLLSNEFDGDEGKGGSLIKRKTQLEVY
jgi:hypothetical protein